jgi:hypothetical protein
MKIEIISIGGDGEARNITPAGMTALGIPVPTPAQELQAELNAKPKPRGGQEVLPAGGLFDPRGPAPLQTKLFTED